MKLIVGLGNPGKEYTNTRHNVGFLVVQQYLKDVTWRNESLAQVCKIKLDNIDVIFILPNTYMNLSGQAVKFYKDYYKIDIADILVIQDDLDLPLGSYRLKKDSSSGGHNGIKSIISVLNTECFLRLKVGISHPDENTIDYVLHKFSKEELALLNKEYSVFNNIINDFIKTNIDLMNKYN